MCLVRAGYWELIVYMQILVCPEIFLVINVIVGSKHVCILLLFTPIIGLKSFKSIVVVLSITA